MCECIERVLIVCVNERMSVCCSFWVSLIVWVESLRKTLGQCCMRNWFACVYHSTQFELSEKCTALHVYSNFIWNWWPQFNRRVLCLYCRRRPPSSTLTLTITYLLTATLFHFVRVLSFSRALPNGTTAKIIFIGFIDSLRSYHCMSSVCVYEWVWMGMLYAHAFVCLHFYLSIFVYWLGECKNCARNKNKPSK